MSTTECQSTESPVAQCAAGLAAVPARNETPLVTVIMPVRNEERHIARSLGAVLAQNYPGDRMEIIVADGKSTDATADIVRSLQADRPNLRLIDNAGGIVPTGMNAAIRLARGEIIVRVDGHTEVAADYIRSCVRALQKTGADNVGGKMTATSEGFFGETVALATSSPVGVGSAKFHYSDQEEWVDTVYLGAWPKATFERIGYFDEEMVRNQDDEFNYRLRAHRGRVLLCPGIKSRYINRSTVRTLWRQYYQYGVWKIRVMQKHPRQMRWRQFAPAGLIVSVAACLVAVWTTSLGGLPLAVLLGAYLAGLVAGAVWTASRSKWRYLPVLPVTFAILHFSYGCGFLTGLIRFRRRWGDRVGKVPAWTIAESLSAT